MDAKVLKPQLYPWRVNAAGRSQAPPTTGKDGEKLLSAMPSFVFKGEEMEGVKVSYSRASSYLSCPQKHHFSYVQKLRTKGVVRPLTFGGDFHKLLELRHKPKKLNKAWNTIVATYDDLPARQQEKLGDTYLQELEAIFSDYLVTWEGREAPVITEHEFLVRLGSIRGVPVYFHGKIDEVYANGDLGEHKTFNTRPDMGILAMNLQSCLYAKAWELQTGDRPGNVRWDYIKSAMSKQPIWLEKTKRFSEATNQQITHLSWLRACEERGITDKTILAKAELYRPNISNFFFRVNTTIVPEMIDTSWRGFKSVCKDITLRGDTNNVKNIGRDCSWCDYRPICYAEFTGADRDYVIKTDYEEKKETLQ